MEVCRCSSSHGCLVIFSVGEFTPFADRRLSAFVCVVSLTVTPARHHAAPPTPTCRGGGRTVSEIDEFVTHGRQMQHTCQIRRLAVLAGRDIREFVELTNEIVHADKSSLSLSSSENLCSDEVRIAAVLAVLLKERRRPRHHIPRRTHVEHLVKVA